MPWKHGELLPLPFPPPKKADGSCYSCGSPVSEKNINRFYCERERCRLRAWLRYNPGWPPACERITPS